MGPGLNLGADRGLKGFDSPLASTFVCSFLHWQNNFPRFPFFTEITVICQDKCQEVLFIALRGFFATVGYGTILQTMVN